MVTTCSSAWTSNVLGLQRLVETQTREGLGGSEPLLFFGFPMRSLELWGPFFFCDENVGAGAVPVSGP